MYIHFDIYVYIYTTFLHEFEVSMIVSMFIQLYTIYFRMLLLPFHLL